jgi:hypothetical protein
MVAMCRRSLQRRSLFYFNGDGKDRNVTNFLEKGRALRDRKNPWRKKEGISSIASY